MVLQAGFPTIGRQHGNAVSLHGGIVLVPVPLPGGPVPLDIALRPDSRCHPCTGGSARVVMGLNLLGDWLMPSCQRAPIGAIGVDTFLRPAPLATVCLELAASPAPPGLAVLLA